MREDRHTTTEAAAADHARILGAAQHIGGDVGDQRVSRDDIARENGPDPWGFGPVHHPTRYDLPMPVEPPF